MRGRRSPALRRPGDSPCLWAGRACTCVRSHAAWTRTRCPRIRPSEPASKRPSRGRAWTWRFAGCRRSRHDWPHGSTWRTRGGWHGPWRSRRSAATRRRHRRSATPVPWPGWACASRPPSIANGSGRRAREQFHAGLVEEARALRERFDPALPAFSAIGYREAWAHLDGALTFEQAVDLDARRNEQFAKRQATWFRSEPEVEWIDATAAPIDRAVELARSLLARA